MIKTVHDNEYELSKKGVFYNQIDGGKVFRYKGVEYFWMSDETYGEWIKRIISCL